MFLPEQAVQTLLQSIRRLSLPKSKIIFTTLPYTAQGSGLARMIQHWVLRKEHITFHWAIDHKIISTFLGNLGYTLVDQIDYDTLHQRFLRLTNKKLAVGEDIHMAVI